LLTEVPCLLFGAAAVEAVSAEVVPEGAVGEPVPDGGEHGGGGGAGSLLRPAPLPQGKAPTRRKLSCLLRAIRRSARSGALRTVPAAGQEIARRM
jgi:hypothetical protein